MFTDRVNCKETADSNHCQTRKKYEQFFALFIAGINPNVHIAWWTTVLYSCLYLISFTIIIILFMFCID